MWIRLSISSHRISSHAAGRLGATTSGCAGGVDLLSMIARSWRKVCIKLKLFPSMTHTITKQVTPPTTRTRNSCRQTDQNSAMKDGCDRGSIAAEWCVRGSNTCAFTGRASIGRSVCMVWFWLTTRSRACLLNRQTENLLVRSKISTRCFKTFLNEQAFSLLH